MKIKKNVLHAFFVFGLVILSGYFFDLSALLLTKQELVEELQKEEQVLMDMQRDLKKPVARKSVATSKEKGEEMRDDDIHPRSIRRLVERVRANNLNLREIINLGTHVGNGNDNDLDHVQLKMRGTFKAFAKWILSLQEVKNALIMDFTLAAQKDSDVLFSVDIWLWPEASYLNPLIVSQESIYQEGHDPFCMNSNQLQFSPHRLNEIDLNQIKMLGMIEDQAEKAALIELGDGQLIKIKKGMHLGIQAASVSAIHDDFLEISLANHQILHLQRMGSSS